jgi:DMSO reductase anchor subunit
MGRVRRHRSFAAWLVMLTLVGNALAAALCLAPQSSQAAPAADDVLGAYVLCASSGGATADHGSGTDRPAGQHCQACVLLASVALLAVVALLLLVLPVPLVLAPARNFARTLADHLGLGGIHSRAPPLSA